MPYLPRSTTNSLCTTQKKYNYFVSNQTVQQGNKLFRVPCFLVNYIPELMDLLTSLSFVKAVEVLAEKYNVNIKPPIQNVRRYRYNTNGTKIVPPVTQFAKTFVFDEKAVVPSHPTIGLYKAMTQDARYFSACNDDTLTFSKTFTDMKINATYWVSILPDFTFPYYYVAVNSTSNILNAHTGIIMLVDDRIIFLPVILKELIFLYKPYEENSSFNFLYITHALPTNLIKTKLTTNLPCYFENRRD